MNVRPFYSEAVQKPWMCQCTYCKDVYVGLIWLRVIYLPKDHNVTLEISGEIYLKICSILFVTLAVIKAKDQHNVFFCFYQCNIIVPITARQNRYHSRGTIYHNTSYRQSAVWNHTHTHTCSCFTSREDYLYLGYCWPLLSLFTTGNHWTFYRTYCTYFSNWSILQDLWDINGDCFFSQQWVHEEVKNPVNEAALFNKLLHVIQSDWNYLTFMLNNNKPVMLSSMSNEIYKPLSWIYLRLLQLLPHLDKTLKEPYSA